MSVAIVLSFRWLQAERFRRLSPSCWKLRDSADVVHLEPDFRHVRRVPLESLADKQANVVWRQYPAVLPIHVDAFSQYSRVHRDSFQRVELAEELADEIASPSAIMHKMVKHASAH